ncbi:thioredoxin TrxA [Streptomyces sp. NPDC020965]|uniref:thioredoxin TrxA n=1 Tax=Streptomyces sp. NPDC020965 TaxID=3365105 RepID=UPI0037AA2E3B
MNGIVIEVTDRSFTEQVLRDDGPVLVEFCAEWAGPCKMMEPVLDEIASEYTGRLTVAKLDIDRNPATAPQHDVQKIPALLIFRNGTVVARKTGALTKVQLKEFLDAHL